LSGQKSHLWYREKECGGEKRLSRRSGQNGFSAQREPASLLPRDKEKTVSDNTEESDGRGVWGYEWGREGS